MRARSFLLLAVLALAVMLFACSPVEVVSPPSTRIPGMGPGFPTPQPGSTPGPTLLERRNLILEWPRTIREKDSELILLTIAMDEDGRLTVTPRPGDSTPVEIPDLYDTHSVVAVARLDLAGMEAYREDIREPLLPGKPVVFRWSIRPNEAGLYRGVVWLRLEFIPKAGGQVLEMVLMARPIEIQAVTVLGLPSDLARIFGGVGLVASTLLGFPFISRWVEERLKRRKPGPPQHGEEGNAAETPQEKPVQKNPSPEPGEVDDKPPGLS
jgi:hypothetical protein